MNVQNHLYLYSCVCVSVCVCIVVQLCPTPCDAMDCSPLRLLCPRNSPDKNTGVGCHSLFQGIFHTQGSNPGLLHCRRIFLPHEPPGKPIFTHTQTLLPVTEVPAIRKDKLLCSGSGFHWISLALSKTS